MWSFFFWNFRAWCIRALQSFSRRHLCASFPVSWVSAYYGCLVYMSCSRVYFDGAHLLLRRRAPSGFNRCDSTSAFYVTLARSFRRRISRSRSATRTLSSLSHAFLWASWVPGTFHRRLCAVSYPTLWCSGWSWLWRRFDSPPPSFPLSSLPLGGVVEPFSRRLLVGVLGSRVPATAPLLWYVGGDATPTKPDNLWNLFNGGGVILSWLWTSRSVFQVSHS